MYKPVILISAFLFAVCSISSCKKDKGDISKTDEELYDLSKSITGFMWYKNSDTLLPKSSGSGHFPAYLRTRYNSIAATQLDANGKVKPDAVFAEGSLIVKELYADTSTFERYAILYKQSGSSNADPLGWVWGYIDADGFVQNSVTEKGAICTSCHLQQGNIDYMLMNKYFP